jgi:hypothetical protein
MGTTEDYYAYVNSKGGVMSADMVYFLSSLPPLKRIVRNRLWEMGYVGNRDRHKEKNVLYFALEALEATIVWEWRRNMMNDYPLLSCVVKGDALWIPNQLHEQYVRRQFDLAAHKFGLTTLQLRTTSLCAEAERTIADIVARSAQRHSNLGDRVHQIEHLLRKRAGQGGDDQKADGLDKSPWEEALEDGSVVEPERKRARTIMEMLGAKKK